MNYKLSLIVPIYNEVGNITPLIQGLDQLRKKDINCPHQLILVDNGSEDDSALEIQTHARTRPWITVVTLSKNRGYGGGIQEGWLHSAKESTHLGWMPADGQYSCSDLHSVWRRVVVKPIALHKGKRTQRMDSKQTQLISRVYSEIANKLLGLQDVDVNGLPKIFPATLQKRMNFPLANSFHFDGQVLLACRLLKIPIVEHPVTFHARRCGVSSWSTQKLRVYWNTFCALWKYRSECRTWFPESAHPLIGYESTLSHYKS